MLPETSALQIDEGRCCDIVMHVVARSIYAATGLINTAVSKTLVSILEFQLLADCGEISDGLQRE